MGSPFETQMESAFTGEEILAALKLMQFSGSSVDESEASFENFLRKGKGKEFVDDVYSRGESVEEAQSSTSVVNRRRLDEEGEDDDEVLPRNFSKYGSLAEIYERTEPLLSEIKNKKKKKNDRGKKRTRL